MSIELFNNVIRKLCHELSTELPESNTETFSLEIEGTKFTLAFQPDKSIDAIFIYCDFGEVPAEMRTKVLRRLLEINYTLQGKNQSTLAFNPETKHVLYIMQMPLDLSKVDSILMTLIEQAAYAKVWRERFFLLENEREDAMLLEKLIQHAA